MHDDPPRAGISHHRPGSRACPGYSDFICLDHLAGGVKGWSDRQKHLLLFLSWPGQCQGPQFSGGQHLLVQMLLARKGSVMATSDIRRHVDKKPVWPLRSSVVPSGS